MFLCVIENLTNIVLFYWFGSVVICFLLLPDNPGQVSRVLVAIETLDLNDNAPELDRQYTTAMCDSSNSGQVSQSLTRTLE